MLTYKFKLYHNEKNRILDSRIDIAGIIYNHCIALHRRYYRLFGKSLNVYQLQKHITKLKRQPRYQFWNMLGSQAIQDITERIDKAYKLFFGNLKRSVRTAPPGFKKVKKYSSFTLKQAGWKLVGSNRLIIMGTVYKFSKSRNIIGKVKTSTIKRSKAGELYVYFVTDLEVEKPETTTGKSAGFDFGLKTFLSISDGTSIESPLFLKQALSKKAKRQKRFARCKRGSSNWHSLKYTLAKLDEHIVNQRRDFFFKLANQLTDRFDHLFFETLNLKGMVRLWGRKVSDLAFGTFLDILQSVASTKGKTVHFIDRWYPSSRLCNCCGYQTKLELADRRWRCSNCQTEHDRDTNAACNIHCEGASSLGLGDVRQGLVPAIPA
ncbi:MAG: transposase [Caldilineaceae bacterium]